MMTELSCWEIWPMGIEKLLVRLRKAMSPPRVRAVRPESIISAPTMAMMM